MKLKVEAKELGIAWNDVFVLYWKRGKWHIYERASYRWKKRKNFRQGLIDEVASEMKVKKGAVMLGALDFLNFEVDIVDCYTEKDANENNKNL